MSTTSGEAERVTIVEMLDEIAARGFCSEPQPHWCNKEATEQHCSFTPAESAKVREFMGKYVSVLRQIDYPMMSFMDEKPCRTASLLSMMNHMLSRMGDCPEYVAQTAGKISRAFIDYEEQFKAADFAREMKTLMQEGN